MTNTSNTPSRWYRLKITLISECGWLLVNGFGLGAYLFMEHWILAPRPESEAFNGIDVLYFWFTKELPLLVGFLVLNFIWLAFVLKRNRVSSQKRPKLVIWILVGSIWFVSLFPCGIATQVVRILAIEAKEGAAEIISHNSTP